jgi:hypothetical protein
MYDIVFISYGEPNAEKNWSLLKSRYPSAKRIDGVKGIHQAHIKAAKKCFTKMFWVVDADAQLLEGFDFNYEVDEYNLNTVHVWRSINPVNDLIYGYGGVKLLPRKLTQKMDTSKPDMTTSISSEFKAIPVISNITAFNTDSFNAWKSGFRECAKLASKSIERQNDKETEDRLDTWCNVGTGIHFGIDAIRGAKEGRKFGEENKNNAEQLSKINDFDWLYEQFSKNSV